MIRILILMLINIISKYAHLELYSQKSYFYFISVENVSI